MNIYILIVIAILIAITIVAIIRMRKGDKWAKAWLLFIAGVVAGAIVILKMKSIQNKASGMMQGGAAGIDAAYKENLAKITQEVANETKQQVIDRFMANFSTPSGTNSTANKP